MGKKSTSFQCTLFDVISMCGKSTLFWYTFFNIISMHKKLTLFQWIFLCNFDGKLIQTRRTSINIFLKDKTSWLFWHLFFIRFWYIKSLSCLNVSMYFSKVMMFHLEICQVIIQCLSIPTLASILSDLICLHLQGFFASVFWNIAGNR